MASHRHMSKSIEQIFDNLDGLLWILIGVILLFGVGAVWGLLQEPLSLSNIFNAGGILVALLTLGYSHYQSNRRYDQTEDQIEELRKTRLQSEYKERSRIIDEAIEIAQKNNRCLSGYKEGEFTGEFESVLELESLDANHQKYFEENHQKFVESLKKQQKYENKLRRLQPKTRTKLEKSRHIEIFVDEHSKSDSDPTEWLIEQIVTFSEVTYDDLEERFDITRDSDKIEVSNSIRGSQENKGPGIFLEKPQPEWMQEYIRAKNETSQYFRSQIETLREIKRDQTV